MNHGHLLRPTLRRVRTRLPALHMPAPSLRMSTRWLRASIRSARSATVAAALLSLCAAATAQSPAADSIRNVADGAYTAAQAADGETMFKNTCGACHGTTEFSGSAFRRVWTGRPVYDLFDQLRNTMPLDNPGGLSREQYANVIAYILKLNQFPAGPVELPSSDTDLRRVRF